MNKIDTELKPREDSMMKERKKDRMEMNSFVH